MIIEGLLDGDKDKCEVGYGVENEWWENHRRDP